MTQVSKSNPTLTPEDQPQVSQAKQDFPLAKAPLGKPRFKMNTLQPWRHQERKSLSIRFEEKYIPEPMSGCWLWTASLTDSGYGQIGSPGGRGLRPMEAHRAAWELYRGKIPDGLDIDHLCRNRACVNPDHLEPVSRQINLLRGIGIPAINAAKTHCKHGHEFTPENTYIHTIKGHTQRQCLTCRREVECRRVRKR